MKVGEGVICIKDYNSVLTIKGDYRISEIYYLKDNIHVYVQLIGENPKSTVSCCTTLYSDDFHRTFSDFFITKRHILNKKLKKIKKI